MMRGALACEEEEEEEEEEVERVSLARGEL